MNELVFEKFSQNLELLDKLLATKHAILIEGNYWHDNHFGICSCIKCYGKVQPMNVLGKILMDVREYFKNKK